MPGRGTDARVQPLLTSVHVRGLRGQHHGQEPGVSHLLPGGRLHLPDLRGETYSEIDAYEHNARSETSVPHRHMYLCEIRPGRGGTAVVRRRE